VRRLVSIENKSTKVEVIISLTKVFVIRLPPFVLSVIHLYYYYIDKTMGVNYDYFS